MLSLVILLTGLTGFGLSFGLLKAGFSAMWMRYPLSVLGAYGIFLVLIRLWVEIERRRFDARAGELEVDFEEDREPPPSPVHGNLSSSRSSWVDWLDFSPDLGVDEGCLPLILLAAVLGLVVLLVSAIAAAPVLIAEVFVDVALAGLLYRRLRMAAMEHWLGTAIRRTWLHVLGAALLLSLVGACLDVMAPRSDSLGKAVKEMFRERHSRN